MNIQDYLPTLDSPPESTIKEWRNLLVLRHKTFHGFLEIEKSNGLLSPKLSFSSSRGQEAIRILCFRVLEELAEAIASTEESHYLEELIDALNYLLGFFLFEEWIPESLSLYLSSLFDEARSNSSKVPRITLEELGEATSTLGYGLGDYLRNRAWMKQTQNTYFDLDLYQALAPIFVMIFHQFPSFTEFYKFFVAKDLVLQFRLRSHY